MSGAIRGFLGSFAVCREYPKQPGLNPINPLQCIQICLKMSAMIRISLLDYYPLNYNHILSYFPGIPPITPGIDFRVFPDSSFPYYMQSVSLFPQIYNHIH